MGLREALTCLGPGEEGDWGLRGLRCSLCPLLPSSFPPGTGEVTLTGPRSDLVSTGKVAPPPPESCHVPRRRHL